MFYNDFNEESDAEYDDEYMTEDSESDYESETESTDSECNDEYVRGVSLRERRLEARVKELEEEIAKLEASFADSSFYTRDPAGAVAANSRLESARVELDAAETRWLELSERNQ